MIQLPLPTAMSQQADEQSSLDPADLEITYIMMGDCPIQLRSHDIKLSPSDAKAVLVVLTVDEAYWANRIADVLDAWETARQSHDPFWITAVAERIKCLARTSNGLMMFTPPVA